jgi:hypothetical protein
VDTSRSGARTGSFDAEWESRVERAASADIRQLLRGARRRRRERWVVSSIVLVAVALVLVLLFRTSLFDSAAGTPAPTGAGARAEERANLALDLTHPFAGTPADSWSDGAAGIVTPPAIQIGAFSAEHVGTALGQVRDLLIASRLDHRLIVDHDPTRFLDALAPDARQQLAPLFGSGHEAEAQALVSLVATDARLLPVPPKVNGTMTVRAGGEGELVVHTNYVFVYPFHTDRPDRVTDQMDILVVVRADVDYVLRSGDRWAPDSRGWWYGETAGYAYSIACDAYGKGFLAPAATEITPAEPSGRDRNAYFDPESPLPTVTGCPT